MPRHSRPAVCLCLSPHWVWSNCLTRSGKYPGRASTGTQEIGPSIDLGFHWASRREYGEPQLTFNYVRALTRFSNDFTFSRGVSFTSAKQYEHIIPALLNRVWETDNDKPTVLSEMAENGAVSGDCFVKVAYERNFTDPAGNWRPGRVRVLPLNAAHCFPEWHPHDKERLIRFRLRYKFWATTNDGTRKVFTYQEIITEDSIQEWVDDQLLEERKNPLGVIPIVHIPNVAVSGSPWGLSDMDDIVPLNQQFNELAVAIADIINYHSAPVTVITGARVNNLEKGARKIWGGLPPDAKVFNLENGVDLQWPLQFLEMLKRSMHEMSGVPENALGQAQPISNTSGVALALQMFPMMQKYNAKKRQYTQGLRRINELILRTLFLFEPATLRYDQATDGIIQPGQPEVIDPRDPLVYQTACEWPPPLPVDDLIKLNEIQLKMGLGLESKRGALKAMGVEFADEKLQELFEEQVRDVKESGALDLITAQIASAILQMTGMSPQGDGTAAPLTGTTNSDSAGNTPGTAIGQPAVMAGAEETLMTELVTQAYGAKTPERRDPENKL
ncbi:phage portal protein [Streptosporangium sp. NPDC050855]|uniref:phage portal protein n=1 Tax=Streptosporangium sp. NPDC050855 TaxID=3366194 RepID=UPI0037BA4F09